MTQKKGQKGFSLVELLIVVAIIGIVAAIAIPNLLASRRAANEGSAVSALRTLNSAQATYSSSTGNGDFGTFAQMRGANLIDFQLGGGSKSGYNFTMVELNALVRDGVTGAITTLPDYTMASNPLTPGAGVTQTGTRRFGSTEEGVIIANNANLGTQMTRAQVTTPPVGFVPVGN